MDYRFILCLAIILISTKVLGLFSRKVSMPAVVGALLAGVILGPSFLNWIPVKGDTGTFIEYTAEIGVILLMFTAGLGTNLQDLKANAKASFVTALVGVIVPLIGGALSFALFFHSDLSDYTSILKAVFVGVVLTATSVSITVETLKELGKLKTRSGNAILGAAVIDDILGIIALTLITSMADESVKISIVLLKIIGFFIFVAVAGFIFYKFFSKWSAGEGTGLQRHVIVSFVFCLFMSYAAEQFFGVADITGAYFAGLIISMTQREPYIASRFDVLSYTYLSPIFFASIGLKVSLPEMNGTIVAFAVVLTIVAILTKVVGCGLGAKLCHYKNYQAIRIGVGMISRGEVALIVASKGESLGLMSTAVMGPVVIVVILTTIIAPILLKPVFKRGPETTPDPNVDMSKNYEAINKFREGK